MTRETKRDTPLSLILELAAEYHSLRWQCVSRVLLTWRGDTSSAPRGAFSGVTSGWFRYVCTDCLCPASAPRDVVTLLALIYLLVRNQIVVALSLPRELSTLRVVLVSSSPIPAESTTTPPVRASSRLFTPTCHSYTFLPMNRDYHDYIVHMILRSSRTRWYGWEDSSSGNEEVSIWMMWIEEVPVILIHWRMRKRIRMKD